MSLTIHLALAACRLEGRGSSHQFHELLRALYVTHNLQEMGFGSIPVEHYARVEVGLNNALSEARREQTWRIDADTARALERIVALHDEQLRSIALRDLTAATERLERFIRSERASPLPEHARVAARDAAAEAVMGRPGPADAPTLGDPDALD